MAQFYTLLTQVGQAKLANAVALGNTIELTHLAVGDGGGSLPTPDSNRTALVNEVRRAPINLADIDPDNPNWIVVEQVLPPDVGGWTIREIGVFDAAGDLIAYGNYPETFKPTLDQGSGRTQTIRMVLQVSHTAAVTLKVDPSVVLATRKYVDDQRKAHEESREHPAATENEQGMARIATQAQVDAGNNDATAVTPKKLRWGVSYSLGTTGYIILPSWLGGIVVQWKDGSISNGAGEAVSYPIAFPTGVYQVVVTDRAAAAGSVDSMGVDSLTNTGFILRAVRASDGSTTNATGYRFIAIGR